MLIAEKEYYDKKGSGHVDEEQTTQYSNQLSTYKKVLADNNYSDAAMSISNAAKSVNT